MKELWKPSNSTICSVSTKFATSPVDSIPRLYKRVPALRQLRRDRIVQESVLTSGVPLYSKEYGLIDTTVI